MLDEDHVLREHLATFGAGALRELEGVLTAPQPYRDEILRQMIARPQLGDVAQLIAMADTDKVVRLLRALRDLGGSPPGFDRLYGRASRHPVLSRGSLFHSAARPSTTPVAVSRRYRGGTPPAPAPRPAASRGPIPSRSRNRRCRR